MGGLDGSMVNREAWAEVSVDRRSCRSRSRTRAESEQTPIDGHFGSATLAGDHHCAIARLALDPVECQ